MEYNLISEGKQQIKVGLELIVWSNLACWDANNLKLVSNNVESFENYDGLKADYKKYGRLICWIIFSVGAEYIGKGFCLVNEHNLIIPDKLVIRSLKLNEELRSWINLVVSDKKSDKITQNDVYFGTLGKLEGIIGKYINDDFDSKLVEACYIYLANSIRNRDVHRYTKDTRGFHFHMVEKLFVPAFNIILKSVEQKYPGFNSQWEYTCL